MIYYLEKKNFKIDDCSYNLRFPFMCPYIESGNSKARSGCSFLQISQKYFVAVSQANFEEINRWLTHQSKALILYFDSEKNSISFFKNFVRNRQSESICSNLMYAYTHPKLQNGMLRHMVNNCCERSKKCEKKTFCFRSRMAEKVF